MAQGWRKYKRWVLVAAGATVTGALWTARQSRVVAAEDHAELAEAWAERHYTAGLAGDETPPVTGNVWRVGLVPAWDPAGGFDAGVYKTLRAVRSEALRSDPAVWLDPATDAPEHGGWFVQPTGTVWLADGDLYRMQAPTSGTERVAAAGSVYGGAAWTGAGGVTTAGSVFPVRDLFMPGAQAGDGVLAETFWKRATGETNHYRWRCELADGTARIPAAVNLAQGFGVVTGLVRTLRICGASYTQEVVRTWATNSWESGEWVYGDPPGDASDSGWAAARLEQPGASVTVTNGGGALGGRVLAGAVVQAESTTDYREDYGGPGQGAYSQWRTAEADLISRGYYGCTVDYPGTWALTNGYVRRVRVYALVFERRGEAEDVTWGGATARTGSAGPAWRPGDFAPGWARAAYGEPCPHDLGYTLARQPVLRGVDAWGFAARGSLVYDGDGAPEFDLPETAAFGMTQPSQALHRLPQIHPYAGWIRMARMKYSRVVELKGFAVVVDWAY